MKASHDAERGMKSPIMAPSCPCGPMGPPSPPKSRGIIAKVRRAGLRALTQAVGHLCASNLLDRTAPSRQIGGVFALGQFHCLFDRPLEVTLDCFALHTPTQKIRPQKFAERRGVLGKAPGATQLAGQRAKRIVDHYNAAARLCCRTDAST